MRRNQYWPEELLFLLYLVTCSVTISPANALLQNIGYLGFLALALYRMEGRLVLTRSACLYGLFIAYSCLSLLWSINVQNSLMMLRIFLKMYGMILVATMYFTKVNTIKTAMRLLYISTVISCLFVLLNATETEWLRDAVGKAQGMDTVRFALKMAFCVYMALYYWTRDRRSVIHLAVMLLFCVVMLRLAKKTSLVFLLAAVSLFLLLKAERPIEKLKALAGITAILLLTVTAIFTIPALRESIGMRVQGFLETLLLQSGGDASTTQRIGLIRNTLQAIRNNPILGNGVNGTRSYLEQIGWGHVTYAHNNFLEILSTGGIVGLALFYSNHALALLELRKRRNAADRSWFCFLMAFLLALCVCDLFQVISESYFEMLLLALLCTGIRDCQVLEPEGGQ